MERREFIHKLALATGAMVLIPTITACGESEVVAEPEAAPPTPEPEPAPGPEPAGPAPVPKVRPDGWDPIAYNRERGNAGAIPEGYLDDINGPDGDKAHLGKHLPYVPQVEGLEVPAGLLAIMWGDPDKGYVRHPNAPKGTEGYERGHWYDWIDVRKATEEEAKTARSQFADWPAGERYAAAEGDDLTADGGKNTVYLVGLPEDVKSGDVVRIHAHCLYHGEYVDFLTLA